MTRTCHHSDCSADIGHLRGDAKFCGAACKQAAWRARETARRAARRSATAAAAQQRDLGQVLRELAAAAAAGSAWIKAGAQLRTVSADELLELAGLWAGRQVKK